MADAIDLDGILKMFRVGPSPQEQAQAKNFAMMRAGLGILAANQPGRTPVNPWGVLAQGGLQGMDAYQNSLKYQMDERRAGGAAALQAFQLKKALDQQEALKGLLSPQEPAGAPPAAPVVPQGVGLSEASAAAVGAPWAAMQAVPQPPPPPAPSAGGFQPIPVDRLAKAAAGGVDIKPFLALNAEARPDVLTVDRGDTVDLIDKRTLKVLESRKKGAAPGAVPFEASDITPAQYRTELLNRRAAGKTDINLRIPVKVGEGLAGNVKEIVNETRSAAQGAVGTIETADRILKAVEGGNVNLGPGATLRNKGDQFMQVLGIAGKDQTERLVNTREVMRGLAQQTVEARKKLRGQGQVTENEGKLIARAESGEIDDFTLPELKSFLNVSKRLARQVHSEHRRIVGVMAKDDATKGLVPYYEVPDLPSDDGMQVSPLLQQLLDKYAPR